jgi:hypothetical protein
VLQQPRRGGAQPAGRPGQRLVGGLISGGVAGKVAGLVPPHSGRTMLGCNLAARRAGPHGSPPCSRGRRALSTGAAARSAPSAGAPQCPRTVKASTEGRGLALWWVPLPSTSAHHLSSKPPTSRLPSTSAPSGRARSPMGSATKQLRPASACSAAKSVGRAPCEPRARDAGCPFNGRRQLAARRGGR